MRHILVGLLILGSILLGSTITRAAEQPDGTVKMTGRSVAAGVGFSWGSGVLTYKGKEYPFSISGLSAGDIGFSSAELSGEVFNLKNIEDFNGNCASFERRAHHRRWRGRRHDEEPKRCGDECSGDNSGTQVQTRG